MQQPIVEQLGCNAWRPAGSARLVDAQVARVGHGVLPEHERSAHPAAAVAARAADAGGLPSVHVPDGTAAGAPGGSRQTVVLRGLPTWPPRLEPLPDGPLSDPEPLPPEATSRHRLTVRRMADPINTWTVAELRYREGAYAWPRHRIATWLVVLGYLLALATILTAVLVEGLQAVKDRHSAPPATSKTLPAQTVQVPVPGGGGR